MNRKFLCGFLLALMGCVCVQSSLEIRVPQDTIAPFANIVNRLTNTTFGLVKGGLNLFTRTVDRIVNTFGRVEDRLRELLEEFRTQIIRGIPEFGIPVLDPLHVDRIQFNVLHEAALLNGSASDVTIKHISKFVLDQEKFTDMGNWNFKLDLNLTLPYIRVDGLYSIDGIIGNTFEVFGDGKFWLNLYDLKLSTSTVIKFDLINLARVNSLKLGIKLGKLENHFDNLMADKETGDLFNRAVSVMAPEALEILWPELKGPVEKQIMAYINQVLENTTIANLARRLFNIRI